MRVVVLAYSAAALALAAQWTAAKIALGTAPPLELSTARFAVATIVLLAACAVTRTALPLREWRRLGVAAALGVLGFNGLAFLGLHLTPASDSVLIVPTVIPVATAVLATLIGERLTKRRAAGFGIASAGAVLLIVGGQRLGAAISTDRLLGDVLALASAVAWAGCLIVSVRVVRRESVLGSLTLMSAIGTALLFPLGFLEFGYRELPAWGAEAWSATVFLGVVSTAFAFFIFFWAVRRFGAGPAALISYLAPIAGLLIAFAVLGERPEPLQLMGGAVILVGVRIATRRAPPRGDRSLMPAPA